MIADTDHRAQPGGAGEHPQELRGRDAGRCPRCRRRAGASSVEPGSAAAQAGLRANDVIVGANRGKVTSVQQLRERAKGAAVLVLEVRRGNSVLLIPLR